MKKYTKYLNYVLRHKWYVMIECFKRGKYWRGLMHDISKFRPDEFIPYARFFNGNFKKNCWSCKKCDKNFGLCSINGAGIGSGNLNCEDYDSDGSVEKVEEDFDIAWLKHIHRNPHHWQYWILREDDGGNKTLQMPGKYIDEMISDWNGAGMAITGKENTREWYIENKDNMNLNENTRHQVETCLNVLPDCMK